MCSSLQYVAEVQSVQERMRFEFVETLGSYVYSWLSFFHVGSVIHQDFKPFLDNVQTKVQKVKNSNFHPSENFYTVFRRKKTIWRQTRKPKSWNGSCSHRTQKWVYYIEFASHRRFVLELQPGSEERRPTPSIKQGYVYMQEKSKIPSEWCFPRILHEVMFRNYNEGCAGTLDQILLCVLTGDTDLHYG